jgi:8-oxo-dGTP pyrophosphatase MutT (NUDIX family)
MSDKAKEKFILKEKHIMALKELYEEAGIKDEPEYKCPVCGLKHILIGKFKKNPQCYALTCKNSSETTKGYTKEQYIQLYELRQQLVGRRCLTGEALIVEVKDLNTAIMLWLPNYKITPIHLTDTFKRNLNHLNLESHNHYLQLDTSFFE